MVPLSNRPRPAWVVRPRPHHLLRLEEFLRGGLVALGWPGLGSLADKDLKQIKTILRKRYKISDARKLGTNAGLLDTFINRVTAGDLVIVPDPKGSVYIGQFRGGYRYAKTKDTEEEGYPHQRRVTWLRERVPIARNQFPQDITKKLKARQPILALSAGALDKLVHLENASEIVVPVAMQEITEDRDTDGDLFGVEGEKLDVLNPLPKRDRKLRDAKIRLALRSGGGRLICEVPGCGFDYFARYGKLGEGFAHVHHRRQLSSSEGSRQTRLSDLAIVCANCHAMIHRGGKCREISRLIGRL